ncbi:MAG: hypothetical protein JSS09_01720, partial [Verrucomicrobia bacterium]|nr:hypothetical protein [Verrucomicrobiota bacterium]
NKILDENNTEKTKQALEIIDNPSTLENRKIEEITKLTKESKTKSIFPQIFASKPKTPVPAPVLGIPNCGNTCFLNAGFQVVMNDPLLVDALVATYKAIPKTNSKYPAYQCFLSSVETYQKGQSTQINLSPLRALFDDAQTSRGPTFGDVTEFINVLIRPVDREEYPHLFSISNEKKTYAPSKKPVSNDKKAKIQEHSNILSDNTIHEFFPISTILLPIPQTTGSLDGQKLLIDYFSQKDTSKDSDCLFISENELKYFQPTSSKTTLLQASSRINISLNRFDSQGQKITSDVVMPKTIRIPVADAIQTYHLKSAALHTGAHYLALIEKDGTYYTANDDDVHRTSQIEEDTFLKQGYLYCYEIEPHE